MRKKYIPILVVLCFGLLTAYHRDLITFLNSNSFTDDISEDIIHSNITNSESGGQRGKIEVLNSPTSYVTDEMYNRAADFKNINASRLVTVMKRAANGDDITVAVIGGSITSGSKATAVENMYASIMKKWWEQTFTNSNISLVNAGVGGTDSYFGVHRMDSQLLEYEPDFVIVEFSVNDDDENFYMISYENLVRRILEQKNSPAVLLLYMNREDGSNAQDIHELIGNYYQLPQISYRDAIMDEINKGKYTWDDISPDNIHPNDRGHAICGELIWKYLNSVYEKSNEITTTYTLKSSMLTSDVYKNSHIFDHTVLHEYNSEKFEKKSVVWSFWEKGWQTISGGEISFTVEAKAIGVFYYKSISENYGKAQVYVDGEYVGELNGYFMGGYDNKGCAEQVYLSDSTAEHVIEIKVPDGFAFDILGLLISD